MTKSLVLTGMMGVGKSTVGKGLAKKLDFTFIDIDSLIEKKEKISINQIFETKGEKYFRSVEKLVTLDQLNKKSCVISLGGGAFINDEIRKKVLKNSISFWLNLSVKLIVRRNRKLNLRPLIKNDKSGSVISKIYNKRKKIYNLADFKIDCDKLSKSDTVSSVLNIYENNKNKF